MKIKTFALLFIVLFCLGVWWWSRSTPWSTAQRALNQGEPGKAVEVLVKALESKTWPREKEESMMELLVMGYWRKSAIDSAEAAMRNLREKYPGNFYATLSLGTLNLLQGRGAFAADYLEEAKLLDTKDIRPYLLLAHYYVYVRDFKKAEKNLVSGLVRFPYHEKLEELLGDLLFAEGRFQAALDKYQPLLASTPLDRQLRLKVAKVFFHSGDVKKVSEILSSLPVDSETDYELELFKSNALFQEGRRKEAASILERLYREANGRRIAGMEWAIALAKDGRLQEAERLLGEIGESIPPLDGGFSNPVAGQTIDDIERLQLVRRAAKIENLNYLRARAVLSELSGHYSDASQYLERALSIDDRDFTTIDCLSELARLKGDPEARLKWADRAVSLYDEHPAALLLRASVNLDLKRTPDAIVDARIVADSYPRFAHAQALLSKAFILMNNPVDALAAAEMAVRLNPGTPDAHLALAIATLANGNEIEAESSFRKSLDIDPRFAEARYKFGLWLNSKMRINEANIQFQEASRLEPVVYGKHR
jgi:tetratricopeptide (TPR) repeat protein